MNHEPNPAQLRLFRHPCLNFSLQQIPWAKGESNDGAFKAKRRDHRTWSWESLSPPERWSFPCWTPEPKLSSSAFQTTDVTFRRSRDALPKIETPKVNQVANALSELCSLSQDEGIAKTRLPLLRLDASPVVKKDPQMDIRMECHSIRAWTARRRTRSQDRCKHWAAWALSYVAFPCSLKGRAKNRTVGCICICPCNTGLKVYPILHSVHSRRPNVRTVENPRRVFFK